jgi:hypothetical protein
MISKVPTALGLAKKKHSKTQIIEQMREWKLSPLVEEYCDVLIESRQIHTEHLIGGIRNNNGAYVFNNTKFAPIYVSCTPTQLLKTQQYCDVKLRYSKLLDLGYILIRGATL